MMDDELVFRHVFLTSDQRPGQGCIFRSIALKTRYCLASLRRSPEKGTSATPDSRT